MSVAHALLPGSLRFSTATRASSPIRPGSTAFANRPTENPEKTSRKPGTGGGMAWWITVRHASELPGRRAERLPPRLVVQQLDPRARERRRVARRDEHACLGRHDVPVPGDVGCDNRRRARERARQHHAEALAAERGRDERLRGEKLGREGVLVEEAEHVDPVLGDVLTRQQEPDGERVGADDAQPRARPFPNRRPRAEQDLETLARLLPAG